MELPKDFRKILDHVTNKRARFVIDTILNKGFCSTEDLKMEGMNMLQELLEMCGS